jgi:beta-phosphoglucomutase-like phosphatase (HAD superfamily)
METGMLDEKLQGALLGNEGDTRHERALALDAYLAEMTQMLDVKKIEGAQELLKQMRKNIALVTAS